MQNFGQLVWRRALRFGIPAWLLCFAASVAVNWHFDHAFPRQRTNILYAVSWFILVAVLTLWNAWNEWRGGRPREN